jgi:ParB family chromosome partitioning protein
MHLTKISLAELRAPAHVARAIIDDAGIEELAGSIKRVGVLQPLLVKEVDGGYEVVAGHRRLLAAKAAGLITVPCCVLGARDAAPVAAKIHENLYRQELTPVEEAAYYAELLPECGDDTDRLAALVRQSRNYVENRLLLLHGDPVVLEAVANRRISLGVGQELNKMPLEADRRYYLGWAEHTGATIATVRQWRAVAEARALAAPAPPPGEVTEPVIYAGTTPQLVCYFCKHLEPASDVEFHYLHRSCRRMVESRMEAREKAA